MQRAQAVTQMARDTTDHSGSDCNRSTMGPLQGLVWLVKTVGTSSPSRTLIRDSESVLEQPPGITQIIRDHFGPS